MNGDGKVGVERAVDVVVLGGSGYVGGELIRLIAGHPGLELRTVCSRSLAGTPLVDTFPHLRMLVDGIDFVDPGAAERALADSGNPLAIFAAAPHGESAVVIDRWLSAAEKAGRAVSAVDLSADFRLPDPAQYAKVYGLPHGAPRRLDQFHCGLPDLETGYPGSLIAHPGCFTTAVTLAAAPLQAGGLAEPRYHVSAVTGSTGSGRSPSATTHHPERHGDLRAYRPLEHRHAPEMELLVGRLGGETPRVLFVPHSGSFARGIHATVQGRLLEGMSADDLRESFDRFYETTPFVSVLDRPPRLRDVVGTNRCAIGVAVEGQDVVVLSVIDNLLKGAAGGAVQWMNRLLEWPETTGLELAGWGWA